MVDLFLSPKEAWLYCFTFIVLAIVGKSALEIGNRSRGKKKKSS